MLCEEYTVRGQDWNTEARSDAIKTIQVRDGGAQLGWLEQRPRVFLSSPEMVGIASLIEARS